MKILIKKSVISGHDGWRNEGEIYELDQKTANHYIAKGIGVKAESHKEEKAPKETKPLTAWLTPFTKPRGMSVK